MWGTSPEARRQNGGAEEPLRRESDASALLPARIVRIVVRAIGNAVAVAGAIPAAALVGPLVVLVDDPAVGCVAIALALGDEMAASPLMLAVSPLPNPRNPDVARAVLDALGAPARRGDVDIDVLGERGKREAGESRCDGGDQKLASHHGVLLHCS